MTNNVKFMLLGIFLAVMSVGGFVLADEEEIFTIIAIALPIAAICAFAKGFMGSDTKHIAVENEDICTELAQTQPVITGEQK